ncbi:MAG: hypothetical protein AB9873_17470 [Syntrophobacteraceae bacterium]
MKKAPYAVILALMVALVNSCSINRPYMVDLPVKTAPSEGKVLVNFVRPSGYGAAAKATLWDGDKLIGVSFGKQSFQYECDPGKHLFVSWSEWKSPVEAELEANKVYFIALRIRMGWNRGRIHQVPINKSDPLWKEIVDALRTNPNRGFQAASLAEAEAEGKPKIREYLRLYDTEIKGTKHVLYLNRQDGVSPGEF